MRFVIRTSSAPGLQALVVAGMFLRLVPAAVVAQEISATGPYMGPPGFGHDMATTMYCGNNPESWIRASAKLDKKTSKLVLSLQLETDSTIAGPKGRASVVFRDATGNELASMVTGEVGVGGKPPGKAVSKNFVKEYPVPQAVVSKTASLDAAVECTGSAVAFWGIEPDGSIQASNLLALETANISPRIVAVSQADAEILKANAILNEDKPYADSFRVTLSQFEARAPLDKQNTVELYQIQGDEFAELPAIGALLLGGSPHCTATMISRWRALTAAHCVKGKNPSDLRFAVGLNAATSTEQYPISSIEPHPDYFPGDPDSPDIAVVVLGKEFGGTPIGVARKDMTKELQNNFITMIGYGFSGRNSAGVFYGLGIKRRIDVKMGTLQPAAMRFEPFEGKTACKGDSGGPALFIDPQEGSITLVGVTAYGLAFCNSFVQDVRVDYQWTSSGSAKHIAEFIAHEIDKG